MRLVSDTGPLIALAQIEQLQLLRAIFEEVLIPPAVESEILAKKEPATELLRSAIGTWIRVVELAPDLAGIDRQFSNIDQGEREAILLAHQTSCLLLVDDRMGREAARSLGVSITGVAGFLIMAKKRGLIAEVLPLLKEARQRGYWLSNEFLELVGRLAGESVSVE